MLNENLRRILFWLTLAVIAVVIIVTLAILLSRLIRPRQEAPALLITPPDITLCLRQEIAFSITPPLEDVEWAATGGTIRQDGFYTAGDQPGDYEVLADGPAREHGRAVVHIIACTPTVPPSPTPTPMPTPTPTIVPTPIPDADAQGDVGVYSTGAPAAQYPGGLDLRNASVDADLRVHLSTPAGLPAEIASWAQEGEAVLWIALYEPIPESLPARADWLFALDLDGDINTGRPAGEARINPDIGMEIALGIYYEPGDGSFNPYLLVWNPSAGDWADGPANEVRYLISEDRTLVALAVPLGTLQQQAAQVTGVTMVPGGSRGRAGAVYYTTPETLLDFYPDRP